MEEKFRIYNEDPLADALRERRDILERKKIKCGPEILHLLLELSDKPLSKSKVEYLDSLKKLEPGAESPLRWDDLVAEDLLLRDNIWTNVDFGVESSESEDGFEDSRSALSRTNTTTQSSISADFNPRPEDFTVDMVDKDGLDKLRLAQFWKNLPSVGGIVLETVKKPISELQAIREVLFMLSGLPTALFEIKSEETYTVVPSKSYTLKRLSPDAFLELLQAFANHGSSVGILRAWSKGRQSTPLLQVFQTSIYERLHAFDTFMSAIQQQFVAIEEDVVVSLLHVQAEIGPYTLPLVRLSKVIEQLDQECYPHAFRYLELVYDETCTAQMAGDASLYAFMGTIFFACFYVYLRPMRAWMEDGELEPGDDVFFVSKNATEKTPASIWQSWYKMRQTQAGLLHAPEFLRAAAEKIFITGKSVVVLKHLHRFSSLQASKDTSEPTLDFETVCDPTGEHLAPFPQLFDVAFDTWVQSKHHLASSRLRATLFDSCGLHTALSAVSNIYFMANGATAAVFINSVSEKLDTLDESWSDRFTLTELAQSTFGSLPSVSPDRLRAHILDLSRRIKDVAKRRRSVKILAAVQLTYRFSWPIQIILTLETIASYQRVFTFLCQIRRSCHVLSRQRLIDDVLTHTSSSDERALYYSLRARIIWFVQTLYQYLTSLVIEPNTLEMRGQLKESQDVDAMIEVHAAFIKSIVDQTLLGSRLELIHNTILKILDLAIKLEDAQAANAAAYQKTNEEQKDMMDHSMASVGLHALRSKPVTVQDDDGEDEDEKEDADVDLSVLSSAYDYGENESYVEKLRKMKADFDRLGRFVARGLRGVARAGSGDEARSWDVLGEMLEVGFESRSWGY